MKLINYLHDSCKPIQAARLEDEIGELASLSLFELENLRCTAAQHRIVQFLIEFRKQNEGMIGIKSSDIEDKFKEMYQQTLFFNSPTPEGAIL